MIFPKRYAAFAARTRIAAGFVVAATYLWFARPTWASLIAGDAIVAVGLGVRAWAAGHLRKNQALAVSGPYAYVRNPLYLGSLLAGIGFSLAGRHGGVAAAVLGFFLLYYLPVVEEEESHLAKILPGYDEYRRRTPRLIPAFRGAPRSDLRFSGALYRKNREYEALIACLAANAALIAKILSGA